MSFVVGVSPYPPFTLESCSSSSSTSGNPKWRKRLLAGDSCGCQSFNMTTWLHRKKKERIPVGKQLPIPKIQNVSSETYSLLSHFCLRWSRLASCWVMSSVYKGRMFWYTKEDNWWPIEKVYARVSYILLRSILPRDLFFHVFNFNMARSCQYWPIVAVPLNHQDKCDPIGTRNYGNETTNKV